MGARNQIIYFRKIVPNKRNFNKVTLCAENSHTFHHLKYHNVFRRIPVVLNLH